MAGDGPAAPGSGPRRELPQADGRSAERADAARNRRRLLDAASRIVAEQGPDAVTMNAVARATGTGVGTVYRRFGSVAQLLLALLDERERQLQEAFLNGPPPLGPDAPPGQRLRAFLHAVADHTVEQQPLLLAAEAASPGARYAGAPYRTMHTHVAALLAEVRPDSDAPLLAHLLLAPLAPSLVHHLVREQGRTPQELKSGIDQLLG